MTENTHRISKLEKQSKKFSNDIHEIKTDVHDIKKDVADGKKVTDMNTKEIKEGNKISNDMLILHTEFMAMFKGGVTVFKLVCKVIAWLIASGIAITGLYLAYQGLS